ncbi:MAG: DUF4058 family protein [Planctomycetaceae bacterium]
MPSPFPGMDPYLERHWGDVHSSIVLYVRDQLRPTLPGDLYARVEERVFIETPFDDYATLTPDVRVIEHPSQTRSTVEPASGIAVAEPVVVHLPDEEIRETFVEIRDAKSGHRVVTVIEVLSPSNKRNGDSRDQYLDKQASLRDADVSLVEIDLLRSGQPTFPIADEVLPVSHRSEYRVCVRRGWNPKNVEVYAVPLRARLPAVPVPLRNREESVPLDLQAILNQAYENGDYEMTVDYKTSPDPPLIPDDANWADELLRGKGLR